MIQPKSKIYIIAEAGVNHNGSVPFAEQLVDVAAEAGADAVKFQSFKASSLATREAQKAGYQKVTTDPRQSQREMLKALELTDEAHVLLQKRCLARGIEFLSSPFDIERACFLANLGVSRLKIPSGELTNGPYLLACARLGLPIILSTGMGELDEVRTALGALAYGYGEGGKPSLDNFAYALEDPTTVACLKAKVTLLHCTTEYPAPPAMVNLKAMDELSTEFGLPVGYSDHTEGITVPVAAAARGAQVIEKHFTLDRGMPGPDHRASIEPGELTAMVQAVREVETAMGNGRKVPAECEFRYARHVRKSVVANTAIAKGQLFSTENLSVKRPSTGLSPMLWWDVLGRRALRDYSPDEPIDINEVVV